MNGTTQLVAVHTAHEQNQPHPRVVRVALAGCGVVGSALVHLLRAQTREIASHEAIRFEIVSVLVRRPELARDVHLQPDRITGDADRFLAADADVVVEAIGGTDDALRIARSTLGRGRRLVTANKALIASHGPELAALARRTGGHLDFEAAVGGGIPVVRVIRDSLTSSGVTGVRGILNGTSNYILSRLEQGHTYAAALAEAQRLGFAEADPARDLSGADAADKVAILGWLAFGIEPATLQVRTRGIAGIGERFAADARAFGGVPRLVAEVGLHPQGVFASVEPTIVAADSEIGRTRDERNVVIVETRWNGSAVLSGPGAGGYPTAAVLLADVRRGAGRIAPGAFPEVAPGGDTLLHTWVVSVERGAGVAATLRTSLGRAGLSAASVEVAGGEGVVRALLAPAPWRPVAALEEALRRAGLRPVVSRYEIPGS